MASHPFGEDQLLGLSVGSIEGVYSIWANNYAVIIGGAGGPNMIVVSDDGWVYFNDLAAVIFHTISPLGVNTNYPAVLPLTTYIKNASIGSKYVTAINNNFAPRRIDVYSNGVLLWQRDPSLDAGVALTLFNVAFSASGRYLYAYATDGLFNLWHLLYRGS